MDCYCSNYNIESVWWNNQEPCSVIGQLMDTTTYRYYNPNLLHLYCFMKTLKTGDKDPKLSKPRWFLDSKGLTWVARRYE